MSLRSRLFGKKSVTVDGYDPGLWQEIGAQAADGFTSYGTQISAGYSDNPYVMRCIDLMGNSVASLEPIIYDEEGNEVQNRALGRLLRKPNPVESWQSYAFERIADLNLNGNLFSIPISTVRGVEELWGIPPNAVSMVQTSDIMAPVSMWMISNGNGAIHVDPQNMIHAHKKLSLDGVLGVSPLSAAGRSISQQTEARKWNLALTKNGAKPSLIILDQNLMTAQQYRDFVSRLSVSHTGSNAGGAMLLDGGKTVATSGYSARDMDYSAGLTVSGREIAIALGVPPELVGDSANKTYANAQEASREFALHTVIPLADRFFGALSAKICSHYEGIDHIGYDRSQIDGMQGDEATMLTALESCSYLTVNEKRARLGYPPVPDGDVVLTAMGSVPLSEVATPIDSLSGAPDGME